MSQRYVEIGTPKIAMTTSNNYAKINFKVCSALTCRELIEKSWNKMPREEGRERQMASGSGWDYIRE